ncbi:MAG: methyltransferase domain-containing protein [Blastocatellia bacterium]|jgi:SAM-dependent methyltransferase|nr:methyltransferase domain-containing protein [Blastocatellia bacterium]
MKMERDYVLGTHDEELARLGLQHRVWRPIALACWQKAGITRGSRVLDIGAGPGYAATDLAEIVGSTGLVVALERSHNFIRALAERCRTLSVSNVQIHELDLMTDELPDDSYDFSWCRWVASFVTDPALLIRKLSRVLRPGGKAIFHEYAHYLTWRFIPRLPSQERFAQEVKASWAATGGKADIGLDLPTYLAQNGFVVRSAVPRIYCVGPSDYMWQWPASFVGIGLARLQELGRIDAAFAAQVKEDLAEASAKADSLLITPLVLEIVAEKLP